MSLPSSSVQQWDLKTNLESMFVALFGLRRSLVAAATVVDKQVSVLLMLTGLNRLVLEPLEFYGPAIRLFTSQAVSSLKVLQVKFNAGVSAPTVFFYKLPNIIRSLSLGPVDESTLSDLGVAIYFDRLKFLEDLALMGIGVRKQEAENFGGVLRKSKGAKRLKKLTLGFRDFDFYNQVPGGGLCMLETAIGILTGALGVTGSQVFPALQILDIGNARLWTLVGCLLQRKDFAPKLVEVRRSCDALDVGPSQRANNGFWFNCNVECTRLWFDLLRGDRRSLRIFDASIHYKGQEGPLEFTAMRQLFTCLAQPLDRKLTSCIKRINLWNGYSLREYSGAIDSSTCQALADAIRAHNFASLSELEFYLDKNFDLSTFISLGKVLHHGYLPNLTALSLGVDADENNDDLSLLHSCWEGFFKGIPAGGLSKVKVLGVGAKSGAHCLPSLFLHAAFMSPIAMNEVSFLIVEGSLKQKDLVLISYVLSEQFFPSLHSLTFEGK